jgi:hypothetical protein
VGRVRTGQSARDAVAAVRGGLRGSVTLGMMLSTGPLDIAAVLGPAVPSAACRACTTTSGWAAENRAAQSGVALLTVTGADLTWSISLATAQARRLSAAAQALLTDITEAV